MDQEEREDRVALHAWEPELPPARFAEEVVNAATAAHPSVRARRRTSRPRLAVARAGAVAALSIAAGVLMVWHARRANGEGEVVASARQEVRIGTRAIAVVEPGAHLVWRGDDVVQTTGEAFYRVETGGSFRVHTPAGDVKVKGTCFDVAVRNAAGKADEEANMTRRDWTAGTIGMAVGALVYVGVHEGKVALARGAKSVELVAGQGASADGTGVHGPENAAKAREGFDGAASSADDGLMAANANLATAVQEYKRRLEAATRQKTDIERRLKLAESKLESQNGETHAKKYALRLDQDDWKRFAEKGQVTYMTPGGPPGPKELARFGLSPDEEAAVIAAHQRSYARTWGTIEPLCEGVVEKPSLVTVLGVSGCVRILMHAEGEPAVSAALHAVADIRAGLVPMPATVADPLEKALLALTGEAQTFERDLAESLGPDEAARLTYQDDTAQLGETWLPDE
jgi:ferric-dicitrate binding protein FerR (iron transport regulator)